GAARQGCPWPWGWKGSPLEVHAAMLRTPKTLTVITAFEAWKSNRTSVTKEGFVSDIKASQRTLQSLRVYLT
ncbi:hypothetical protein RFZ01_11685, partial [Acinetobacter pittii]|uniref:hypothetical protein n=1 Tax=Acinetobacter pittii TaxID=48296 RepID=UPI0028147114